MTNTEPTHHITHRRTGTSAFVPLAERLKSRLEANQPLTGNDKKYVAMAFKNTLPHSGPDMSDEFVAFGALDIQPIPRGSEFGEPPVQLDPSGMVIDDDDA